MKCTVTNNRSRISSARVLCKKGLLCAFAAALALCPATMQACEGPELAETLQILQSLQNDSVQIAYQCGMSVNPLECMLQAINAINNTYGPLINNLSPSCRALIERAGQMSGRGGGGGGGVQCMGGVCCDSSGCYQ